MFWNNVIIHELNWSVSISGKMNTFLKISVVFFLLTVTLTLGELSGPLNTLKKELSKSTDSDGEAQESPSNLNDDEDNLNDMEADDKGPNSLFAKMTKFILEEKKRSANSEGENDSESPDVTKYKGWLSWF